MTAKKYMPIRIKIAVMLINARGSAGLTQRQLAEKMGTSQSAVARLESGKANARMSTLVAYAYACGGRLNMKLLPR